MATQKYWVENIAGGGTFFSSLDKACEAATGWGEKGTIEDKKGIRHVAHSDSGDGYEISEYGESADDFGSRAGLYGG